MCNCRFLFRLIPNTKLVFVTSSIFGFQFYIFVLQLHIRAIVVYYKLMEQGEGDILYLIIVPYF